MKFIQKILVLLFFLPLLLQAQETKKTSGVLKYRDITAFKDTSKYVLAERTLIFNADESILFSNSIREMRKDTIIKQLSKESTPQKNMYKNFVTNKIVSSEAAFTESVLMTDTLIGIDWIIFSEKRKIGNFNCQKAEADVRGRHYTAWFTPDVPVSNGPWKLHGLPGLILEAYDSKKSVRFEFESLTIPAPSDIKIEPLVPKVKQKIVRVQDYIKLAKENKDNFIKMLKSDSKDDTEIKIEIETIEIFTKQ